MVIFFDNPWGFDKCHLCDINSTDFLKNVVSKKLNIDYLSKSNKNEEEVIIGHTFCPHNLFIASIPLKSKYDQSVNVFFLIDPISPYSYISEDTFKAVGIDDPTKTPYVFILNGVKCFGFYFASNFEDYKDFKTINNINILGKSALIKFNYEFNYFNSPPTFKLFNR